jgi:FAD/FMN-containing dehydrogenase
MNATVLDELRATLDANAVLAGDDVPRRNRNDYSGLAPTTPLALVRPADTEGVAAALRICHRHDVAVVPQGGLTGLCGGGRAGSGQIALSLERMVGIEEIDSASATMTVKAGTPLEAVQQAADAAGFFCPLDLGARGSCAIGGNLSTNAGGNRVIRYGMARDMVLGLEVVLPDGTVVTNLNKMLKNNAGYDLKQLFIGSEGTLGIITRVVLRLYPKPGCTMSALCARPDYESVVKLLAAARRGLGPQLSAFEVMWPDYWKVVTERVGVRSPVATEGGVYVLVEAQGTDEAIDGPRFQAWMERVMEQGLLADAAVAQSVGDTQSFWALRDACAEFFTKIGPHISYDIGLPVRDMDAYVQRAKPALAARIPGCEGVHYGHIGDGNMHMVVWVPGLTQAQQPKELMDEVLYGLVRDFGGTVSAEHGIGLAKKKWLGHARSEAEIALMRTIKAAMDPRNLLNPGKIL